MYQTSKVDPDPKMTPGRPFLGGVQAALDGSSTSQEGTSPWHKYPHAHPHAHAHSQQQHEVVGQSPLSESVEEVLPAYRQGTPPVDSGSHRDKGGNTKGTESDTEGGDSGDGGAPLTAAEYEEAAMAWAEAGLAEHASVASFAHVTLQLMAVGAPPDILKVGYYGRSLWVMVS